MLVCYLCLNPPGVMFGLISRDAMIKHSLTIEISKACLFIIMKGYLVVVYFLL